MDLKEMKKLFAKTAIAGEEGRMAFRAFASALTTPILQKLKLTSIMRELFAVENLEVGAQA